MRFQLPHSPLAAPTDDNHLRATRRELRERLLRGESVVVTNGGQMAVPTNSNDNPTPDRPSIVVPPGKLA